MYWFNTSPNEYVIPMTMIFIAFENSLATVTHGFDFFFLIRCWTRWWIESQPCRVYPECYMTWPLSPRAPQSGSSVMAGHKRGLLCPWLKRIKLVLDRTVNCDTVIKNSNFYLAVLVCAIHIIITGLFTVTTWMTGTCFICWTSLLVV